MKAADIRKAYLDFFASKGHRIMRSDSLVPPAEDKSLLFTGAGMNQFKNEFMGRGEPGLKRATTCQKCLRTGDIDNVGRTAYHHTFFEMLGDFSFGDYFKRESIAWAWEFMTETMGLPPERLQVSVYEDDDEAFAIWNKDIGLDEKTIHRFGEHENFWPADCPTLGPNGLCGPCSEIFFDWGPDAGCGRPDCNPSCDCGRFCEVWNLVFQQFERKDGGVLEPLPSKNIDTGMGLERMAAVMQGVRSNFDTDFFTPIVGAVEREADKAYAPVRDAREGMAFRRIADHVRASVFCISDGILPGNTGRGYVLRKLIRRAVLDGGRLSLNEPFLYKLVPVVAKIMGDQYPELIERRENIARLIQGEEERFLQTLDQGLGILKDMMASVRAGKGDTLTGADAFKLFDTYGLPLDVTESILEDEGLKVDRDGFENEMNRQRSQSRAGTRIADDIFGSGPLVQLREQGCSTEFVGYDRDAIETRIAGIVAGDRVVSELAEGEEGMLVLERTTFYGESGGEVGDSGLIESAHGRFEVADTQRGEGMILHTGKAVSGRMRTGDAARTNPDVARRAAIRRAHTATHLLHKALRETLGKHAEQSGSLVEPDRLRFDFTHMKAMTPKEIRLVETKVNGYILRNSPVAWKYVGIDEAKSEGAMALFGEKYGDVVRMLSVGDYSKELCGGLHCSATGDIGFFKISAEGSVAAGIRRIEAVTGMAALKDVHDMQDLIRSTCAILGAQEARLVERAEQLGAQVKQLRKDLQKARRAGAPSSADYLKNAKDIGGARFVIARIDDAGPDELRAITDRLRQNASGVGAVLAAGVEGKVNLVAAFTKDLVERGLHAGKIAGAAAKLCDGGGGGRPDLAQAGGKDPGGIDAALAKAEELIAEALK